MTMISGVEEGPTTTCELGEAEVDDQEQQEVCKPSTTRRKRSVDGDIKGPQSGFICLFLMWIYLTPDEKHIHI